jgi:hypothetical protein
VNADAEYVYLAIDEAGVGDSDALCRALQKHLEGHLSTPFRNRIRSLHWHVVAMGDCLLIHLAPGRRELLSYRRTPFFAELITQTMCFLASHVKSPRLVFYNDEISCEEALRNQETWTIEKLQTERRIPAGISVAISDIT